MPTSSAPRAPTLVYWSRAQWQSNGSSWHFRDCGSPADPKRHTCASPVVPHGDPTGLASTRWSRGRARATCGLSGRVMMGTRRAGAAGAAGAVGAAGAAGAVSGCALGCGPHGACDLRHARCVCDPPWSGADCADPSVAVAPSAVRRVLRVFMLLSAAVVGGLGLGYLYSRYSHIFGTKRRGYQRIGEAQRDL